MADTTDKTTAREENGNLVADRDLYLDASGRNLVEEGAPGSATQLVSRGHAITRDEVQRLHLSLKDGRVVQDQASSIDDLRSKLTELEGERDAHAAKIRQYQEQNAVKDIPNTMEAVRVAIEARIDRARLDLSTAIKDAAGKDPSRGESQATAVRPDLDTATPENPADKPAQGSTAATTTGTANPPADTSAPTTQPGKPATSTTKTPPGRGE
jgi:hypothetical protein